MGRIQVGGNFLQDSGPSDINLWFGDVGPFGGNVEEGRRGTHRFPHTDHGEASAADRRREVGDAQGVSSAGSGRNAVGNDLYRETTGNRGTVGGVTTNIRSMCRVEGLRGGWTQEGGLVVPRGYRETTLGHLCGSLAVS